MAVPISVVIITYNEEDNLPRTLAKLKWCDDIVIVDSGSTDNTSNIAMEHGARFYSHLFEGYGKQKNYGFLLAKHDWILSIDADEVLTDGLIEELHKVTNYSSEISAYRIPIRNVFLEREFKYGKESNFLHLRLFKNGIGSFNEDEVHEKLQVKGQVGSLKNHILHYSYKSVPHYMEKLETYTTRGAYQMYKNGKKRGLLLIYLLAPFYFFKHYVLYGNFLNGKPGFIWSILNAKYHTVKYLKLFQLNQSNQNHS